VATLREASSLTDEEAQAGWVLTCAHAAATDVVLEVEDLSALAGITPKTLPARINSLDLLAPDVLRIALRLPPASPWRFLPGQSIDINSPDGVKRSYSLASDAAHSGSIELHVRHVEGGLFSAYWFGQARTNDLLRFRGPIGTFYLRPCAGLHLVFLATGTGLAPFQSMLLQLAVMPEVERPASVTLYWGGRQLDDLYIDPARLWRGLHYVPVLSRAGVQWQGARGHVQDVFLASHRQPLSDTVVYACGSSAMIDGARQSLLNAGLAPGRFHFDAFVPSN
jgi:CDP-4-dehydro-6-deoxyglucose reductase